MQIPLGLGSYQASALPFSSQRAINLYAVIARDKSLSEYAFYQRPGIVEFCDLGGNESRGSITMGGVYYNVNGTSLYSIDSDGVETLIGNIAGINRCSMDHNGSKLCIVVPGGNGYVYDSGTSTLSQITDPDYIISDTVRFKDGYFNFSATAGDVFFCSALNDPTSIDPLDYGTAELSPDKIKAVFSNYDELLVFGEFSTEIFENIGGSGFPWQRIRGASFEKGIHAIHSIVQIEGAILFLGGGRNEKTSVFLSSGSGEPIRISTDAIDAQIQNFTATEISSAFSFSFSVNGVSLVGWTLQSVNIASRTIVYNITSSQLVGTPIWSEFQTGVTEDSWRVSSIDYAYNKLIVSDTVNGKIGYLDTNTYTEYNNSILRRKTTPPISNNGKPIRVSSLELTIDSGAGVGSGEAEPQVMMDYSDDGGRTWTSESWVGSMGAIGEYFRRTVWRRLGRIPYYRIFSFSITDEVKTVLIRLDAEII